MLDANIRVGPHSRVLSQLQTPDMTITNLGEGRIQATRMKVLFAAINKGTVALLANVFAGAEEVGLRDAVKVEVDGTRPELFGILADQAGGLGTKAARWAIEMEDLAAGLEEMRVDGGYHATAAQSYRRLAQNLEAQVGKSASNDPLTDIMSAWRKLN